MRKLKKRTRNILNCNLPPDDISLLNEYDLIPHEYILTRKTCQTKYFRPISGGNELALRW